MAGQALLQVEPTNIAVYLGKASGGLCAIDFDADEDLAAFMAVNPKLGGTGVYDYVANAVGALTTTQRGAIPALPTWEQVNAFMSVPA